MYDFTDYVGIFVCLIVAVVVVIICTFVFSEIKFSFVEPVAVECHLLSIDHMPSTLQTHVAPIISSDGKVATAVYSTGKSESMNTVWDCGKYGRLTCSKKDVFRFAQKDSVLLIRSSDYDTRIVGIVR